MSAQNLMLADTGFLEQADSTVTALLDAGVGANFFEEEIDEVLFHTNSFLTDGTFTGAGGPFTYILMASMSLAAIFAIIYGAGMAYRMMYKGEPFDPLKILKVVGVAFIMSTWYTPGGMLDCLAVIPNSIGSWTKTLYDIEVQHVSEKFSELTPKLAQRDMYVTSLEGVTNAAKEQLTSPNDQNISDVETQAKEGTEAAKNDKFAATAGTLCLIDKIFFLLGIGMYRLGFWGTIFAQQIILGMLTIFGPIQWAFCLLPKWEGAWAKWIIRYLTVHFYGAMLYFVGFYVLLLFDIVFSIQLDQVNWIIEGNGENIAAYVKVAFFTSLYMVVAGTVALRCLSLVPDLAAWMIPEGDTAYSTRSFGEGVATEVRRTAHI